MTNKQIMNFMIQALQGQHDYPDLWEFGEPNYSLLVEAAADYFNHAEWTNSIHIMELAIEAGALVTRIHNMNDFYHSKSSYC